MFKFFKTIKLNKPFLIITASVCVLAVLSGGLFLFRDYINQSVVNYRAKDKSHTNIFAVLADSTSDIDIIKLDGEPTPAEEAKDEEENDEPASAPVAEELDIPAGFGGSFQWGATMRPSAYGYSADNWAEQIGRAKEMGLGWARLNWDYGGGFARNDAYINQVLASGMNVVLVIEDNPATGGDMYGSGLDDGKSIAGHYAGKISYYQLANEGGAQSIRSGGLEGSRTSDYDEGAYQSIKEYIRGLSDGINSVDPGATKIVTISWLHTGFLDRLKADGVDFDMIGIDWYDWMGSFSRKTIHTGATLYDKLRSFGKPLTFMEINVCPTSEDGSSVKTVIDEAHQTDYLTNYASWARGQSAYIKGFYILELVDNVNNNNANKEYYGLIRAEMGKLGEPRQAFYALKDLIN